MVLRQKEPLPADDIHHLHPHTALSTMTLSPPLFLMAGDSYQEPSPVMYKLIHSPAEQLALQPQADIPAH